MLYYKWLIYIISCLFSWCGPCKLLIPRLESLGAVKDGKAILAKIDIDELPDLAGNYGVCFVFNMLLSIMFNFLS